MLYASRVANSSAGERFHVREAPVKTSNTLLMKRALSVIVPVYNSEASLLELVNRLRPVLQTIADDAELILINDASTDKSWEIVQQLAKQNAWIRGINLMRRMPVNIMLFFAAFASPGMK